ncbi:MAG: tetratricopeptide repeat protein [Bacteroidales bacterium]|nr:tetratricopeptide repeat protein [Bacteroidales bacterium]
MKSIVKSFISLAVLLTISFSVSAQKETNQYEPKATFERGLMLFENKHYASALECFEYYIETSKDNNDQELIMAKYYEAVSSLFLDNGKGENKIITFVKENPTNLLAEHANFLYANTLFKDKKYRNALKVYQDINTASLNTEEKDECKFKEAYCHYQTNDIEKATPLFKELTEKENAYRDDAIYYYAHILYINDKQDEALNYFNILKNKEEYKDIANTYILQINFDKGNYSEVAVSGDNLLDKSKKKRKADIALMLAESWHQQGDYAKSLEYYNIALENSNRKLPREVEFRIGFCKMKTNDFEGAIEHLTKVTDKNDELGQYGSYYLAQCYTNTEQDKFARNTFYKAYKMNYNDTLSENALFNYAALSFIPGIDPFNETISTLNDYIENNPNSNNISDLQDIVIHLLLNANNYNEALKTIEGYSSISPELEKIKSQLNYHVGIQLYNEGDFDNSIVYLKKTVDTKNSDPKVLSEALYWMAEAYQQKKDDANAFAAYQKFIKSPSANSSEFYPLAYYNVAYIYLGKADFNNASIKFKEFLNFDKSANKTLQNDAWMRIGDCYFIQRQYNNAITAYSNAIKINNKNTDYAYYQQGMGYGALGKTNEKINCLNIIASNYKKSSFYDKALYEIGLAHLSTNDNRSAIVSFDRIIKEKPRSSYARLALMKIGMIYYNNDEYDKALERLKNVVAQYPNTEESREALNLISNIYRDQNDIQAYFDYIEKNNLATISIDKQDSLSFVTINDFYSKRDYIQTLKGAKQYLKKYPEGAYLLKVHYYAMTSMENLDETDSIRTHIEYIINQADNDYTDNALLLIARMDYDASNYASSATYYERLINITENQQVLMEATEGCMKSYYFNQEYDKAIEKANLLVVMSDISENQKNQANYILGKSYFDKKNYGEALKHFDICTNIDKTETGAECGYLSAVCLYKTNRYDEAEEKVFEVSDSYNTYIYWTAKSFIILSDVYVAKDNAFQAKETLKSVIENYPQDETNHNEIVREAQSKLEIINAETNE